MPAVQARTATPTSTAFPYNPVVHASDKPAFKMFLAAWNQAADVMKLQPAGSRGWFGGHRLVMAPLDGELVLFASPDLAGLDGRGLCTLKRAEDFESCTTEELNNWTQRLRMWAAQPLMNPPVTPESVAASVSQQYGGESPARWHWEGLSAVQGEREWFD